MLRSIVIPVYRGENSIGGLVDRLVESLGSNSLEIVLVNDGSPDRSHEICLELQSRYPQIVQYVLLAKNFGEHNAVMAGLNHVSGDYTAIVDDDFQNPPEEVARLFEEAEKHQYDITYTYYEKKEHPFFRNLGSRFNDRVATVLLDKPKNLYLSSFKCLSRFAVAEVIKYTGPFPYIDGLALRSTRNIGRLLVRHQKRRDGPSSYTFRKLVRLWLNMFINFSVLPLRMSFFLGVLFSLFGAIFAGIIIVEKTMSPHLPMGYPSLMVTVVIFSGVQLIMLGLMGEYLGHLLLRKNQQPQFVVREVFGRGKGSVHG